MATFSIRSFIVLSALIGPCSSLSRAQSSDSLWDVRQMVGQMMDQSFYPHPDSSMNYVPLSDAYLIWSQTLSVSWSTPVKERVLIYRNRFRASVLSATLKVFVFPKFARMGSGVLPLTDAAIIRYDSALVYFPEFEPYLVGGNLRADYTDLFLARSLKDSLIRLQKDIHRTSSFYPAVAFDLERTLENIKIHLPDSLQRLDRNSIFYWIQSGDWTNYPRHKKLLDVD